MGKLDNKVTIVTGAASGMGKEIAVLFAAEGAKVIVSDLKMEAIQPVVDEIKAKGGTAAGIVANVAKEEDVQAMPIFKEKKSGVIVNIASAGGLFGSRAGVAYTASKHAVVGLTKNVGFQYAKLGIRCNAIAPGAVSTNIAASMTKPNEFGMERAMAGINLSPRTGEAKEIATVALFLASDDASFVNGAILAADGGWSAY